MGRATSGNVGREVPAWAPELLGPGLGEGTAAGIGGPEGVGSGDGTALVMVTGSGIAAGASSRTGARRAT
jgi:hypothetical protein